MTQERQLRWHSPNDLVDLAKKFKDSLNSSMESMDPDCPEKCSMVTPAYITDEVFIDAIKVLRNPHNRDPMVIVDMDADRIEISFVTINGHKMYHMSVVETIKLSDFKNYDHSREIFLAHIAQECYKLCSRYTNSFQNIKGKRLLCGIIFRFKILQTSIKDSTLTKFSKGFFVPNCEGKDLAHHFNNQLDIQRGQNKFQIYCTHLMNSTPQIMTGMCTDRFDDDHQPDMFITIDHGCAMFFFENDHKLNTCKGKRVLMDVHYREFGAAIGSLENNFLRRFLTGEDYTINNLYTNQNKIGTDYFIGGCGICDTVLEFLKRTVPDFETKFSWLNRPKSIKEGDISDLIESVKKDKKLEGTLLSAYYDLDGKLRQELYQLCIDLRNRSAAIAAAVSYGIMERVCQRSSKKSLVVGLSGRLLLDMFGYKDQFVNYLQAIRGLNSSENAAKFFDIECIDADKLASVYGVVALSKYINSFLE